MRNTSQTPRHAGEPSLVAMPPTGAKATLAGWAVSGLIFLTMVLA